MVGRRDHGLLLFWHLRHSSFLVKTSAAGRPESASIHFSCCVTSPDSNTHLACAFSGSPADEILKRESRGAGTISSNSCRAGCCLITTRSSCSADDDVDILPTSLSENFPFRRSEIDVGLLAERGADLIHLQRQRKALKLRLLPLRRLGGAAGAEPLEDPVLRQAFPAEFDEAAVGVEF